MECAFINQIKYYFMAYQKKITSTVETRKLLAGKKDF